MDATTANDAARTYSLYLDADLNRVFTDSVAEIAAAELRVVADALGKGSLTDIERLAEGRSRRLRFTSDIDPASLGAIVGQLSASAQLFVHELRETAEITEATPVGDERTEELLRPLLTAENLTFGSELVTTQRYRGKTNERLTRTMLNIALATAGIDPAAPAAGGTTPTVLDPMCGRGTTLNWALAYGLNGVGIDVERSSLDQHAVFLQTWAKRARLPHKMQRYRPGNGDHRNATFDVAPDRVAFKGGAGKGGAGQRIETYNADGGEQSLAIKRSSVDVIVTDLPYGIQHRGASEQRRDSGKQRPADADDNPETCQLVERVLGTWDRWLKPSGSICLAWNAKRASRRDLSGVLAAAGFTPVTAPGGYSMRHVVDATIDRDVIVACRA